MLSYGRQWAQPYELESNSNFPHIVINQQMKSSSGRIVVMEDIRIEDLIEEDVLIMECNLIEDNIRTDVIGED